MRGGKRKGAGRKALPTQKLPYSTRLRGDQLSWLRQPGRNAAKEIEKALDAVIPEPNEPCICQGVGCEECNY